MWSRFVRAFDEMNPLADPDNEEVFARWDEDDRRRRNEDERASNEVPTPEDW